MAFNEAAFEAAKARQRAAAEDASDQVMMVAGPGSGKSFTIEHRVAHLLNSGVMPMQILITSFTRNSAADLRDRVVKHCANEGIAGADTIHIGTLHSVALRVMQKAGLLTQYPVPPRVVDDWEMEHWIDSQFSKLTGKTPGRAKKIREYFEAWWSTDQHNPANYVPETPPISDEERAAFAAFHNTQSNFYAAIQVGEVVRLCNQNSRLNFLDAKDILGIQHVIVDEYQDLNPMDLEFVDDLIEKGVTAFVAGDDDQSVYSFRHASPAGIQTFTLRHQGSGEHQLTDCFRCTPRPLTAAQNLLADFSPPGRIPKQQTSMFATSDPTVDGHVGVFRYPAPAAEAEAIARSCVRLNAAGVAYDDIMILLCNQSIAGDILKSLDDAGVPTAAPGTDPFRDTKAGRAGYSLLRLLSDDKDLIACRNLTSFGPSMGPTRCLDLTNRAVEANLSARDLYLGNVPDGVFTPAQWSSVEFVRACASEIAGWDASDTIAVRGQRISELVAELLGNDERDRWISYVERLPVDSSLADVLDLLHLDHEFQIEAKVALVHQRLGLEHPNGEPPARVRMLTMHGAKGLAAEVVFIPGLEESIFPTSRRAAATGLVQEGARLLYVSLTRAKAAVVCSFAFGRIQFGSYVKNPPSRYLASLNVGVRNTTDGLTAEEAVRVAETVKRMT